MNISAILIKMKIDPESRVLAVQQVRAMIEGSANPVGAAEVIIKNLSLADSIGTTDANEARMLAAMLVEEAIRLGDAYDPSTVLIRAAKRVEERKVTDPWLFTKDEQTEQRAGTTVEVKADGSLKKGSKQILAAQLYETHKALDNKQLIALFEKELDMGTAGARTYVYNLRKVNK